ncbi:LPS-assembly lipoprotein LptE [Coxiella endosymbiont of Amblyomma nuttalli]|uniref:LPS-assembly lipoprotein LptE n=1 Tax=Coxiella endosymbiont of Amblyomma nuttalli TaxID=2749996 RepID=UPI001BACD320|nr:hypothetical protein [Coxiella endosymbiont of Amblyomma nuttalli]QTS83887.1 Lipopolysaccharide-assembly lipoprotein LptE [Coxiella endosymbiont of Amblyomma nuttalli]
MNEVKSNIVNLFKTLLMGILICSILVACGFKPHLPSDITKQMRILYLDSPNPYHPLIVQLRHMLQALNVQFTQRRKSAPVILQINNIGWDVIIPPIVPITNNTIVYTYTLHVKVVLETKEGKKIRGPHTFSLSRTLVQNSTQLYTPNATYLMKREMTRIMVNLIYHYLITTTKLLDQ